MEERRCAACGKAFRPCPRVGDQKYCGDEGCRRSRRRRWQRAKRQGDADYRDNQVRAQRAWARENSTYWQGYRSRHPHYAQANREKQRLRDRRRHAAKASGLAKMDSIGGISTVPSGTYLLVPQGEENLAKLDSIMVEITFISKR
jgi:hypothetical protein